MSNKLWKSLALTPVLALMAACASGGGGGGGAPPPPAAGGAAPGATTLRFSGQLLSTGARTMRGSAAATTIGQRTEVVVSVTGGAPSGQHPWHLHRGACGSGGAVVGSPGAYAVLRPDASGGANETANISVALQRGQRYHVNVHESPQNPGNIVACAELSGS